MFSLRRWGDADYWYFEFELGSAFEQFSITTLVPADILEKIKNDNNTFLVASNAYESFHDIVLPLYESLVIKHNIPPHKILLLSESADLHTVVRSVAQQLNLECVRVEWTLGFERMVKKYKKEQPTQLLKTLTYKQYPKKYLNFNRRWRLHRPTLVALLAVNNLLDCGHVSLGVGDDFETWEDCFVSIKLLHPELEIKTMLDEFERRITSLPPMYLDTTDLVTNQAHITNNTDQYYENSYFSVVSETNFYTNASSARFFSEKTFKPFASLHPFILVAVPNSLPLLHQLGYKSFHPLIDESYDAELNDSARLVKILKEIERLCNLSNEELVHFLNEAKPIVIHNFATLMTRSDRTIQTL
jgi:hypothetical protein